jgi:hypothetical protein
MVHESSQRRTEPTVRKVRQFDAVGVYSDRCERFVRHAGLACEEAAVAPGAAIEVRMIHMAPPLTNQSDSSATVVDTFGTAELSADEISILRTFVAEAQQEYLDNNAGRRDQYHVLPHFVDATPGVSVRRFSCSGFVYECYRELDIRLVDLERVPRIELTKLEFAYPALEGRPKLREEAGLSGDGPWPVLLPGYLFHSLSRDPPEIRRAPYQAQSGDECFPRRAVP